MPPYLQEEGIRGGNTEPLNAGELLRQVADALALCRHLELEDEAEMAQMAQGFA
jgi:hypothetical protein